MEDLVKQYFEAAEQVLYTHGFTFTIRQRVITLIFIYSIVKISDFHETNIMAKVIYNSDIFAIPIKSLNSNNNNPNNANQSKLGLLCVLTNFWKIN